MNNKLKPGQIYTRELGDNLAYTLITTVEDDSIKVIQFGSYMQSLAPTYCLNSQRIPEDIQAAIGTLAEKDTARYMATRILKEHHFDLSYFEQLWSELDRLDTTLVFQVGKVYQSFTTKEYFIVTKLLNNRPLLAPVGATHYITQTYSKEFIATLTEPPYPERLYQLSSIKVRVQQAIDEYSEYMRFIDNSLTLLSKENYQ